MPRVGDAASSHPAATARSATSRAARAAAAQAACYGCDRPTSLSGEAADTAAMPELAAANADAATASPAAPPAGAASASMMPDCAASDLLCNLQLLLFQDSSSSAASCAEEYLNAAGNQLTAAHAAEDLQIHEISLNHVVDSLLGSTARGKLTQHLTSVLDNLGKRVSHVSHCADGLRSPRLSWC